jgi:citrate synthase
VLLALLASAARGSPRLADVDELSAVALDRGLPRPDVGFALGALSHVGGFERGAAEAIFAIARAAGWIAHAIEVYEDPAPPRPRAVYVGPAPGDPPSRLGA